MSDDVFRYLLETKPQLVNNIVALVLQSITKLRKCPHVEQTVSSLCTVLIHSYIINT